MISNIKQIQWQLSIYSLILCGVVNYTIFRGWKKGE